MKTTGQIMKSAHIQGLNKAIVVLRHFVDLSAKLLPFLQEINTQSKPGPTDLEDRRKIIEVYQNYHFDTSTSRMLIDSNILSLIKTAYQQLESGEKASAEMQRFFEEFQRLQKNWSKIDAN